MPLCPVDGVAEAERNGSYPSDAVCFQGKCARSFLMRSGLTRSEKLVLSYWFFNGTVAVMQGTFP